EALRLAARALQSAELDLAGHLVRQTRAAERHHRLGGQFFMAIKLAFGDRLAHRLLDLALRAHAQRLEEFANAAVENVLLHCPAPLTAYYGRIPVGALAAQDKSFTSTTAATRIGRKTSSDGVIAGETSFRAPVRRLERNLHRSRA